MLASTLTNFSPHKDENETPSILEHLILDEKKYVTYKWLANHFQITTQKSKSILEKFLSQQEEKKQKNHLKIYYCIIGVQNIIIERTPPPLLPQSIKNDDDNNNTNNENDVSDNDNDSFDNDDGEGNFKIKAKKIKLDNMRNKYNNNSNEKEELESEKIMIVEERKMEETKQKFLKVFDCHIYGLCFSNDENKTNENATNENNNHNNKNNNTNMNIFYENDYKQLNEMLYDRSLKQIIFTNKLSNIHGNSQYISFNNGDNTYISIHDNNNKK